MFASDFLDSLILKWWTRFRRRPRNRRFLSNAPAKQLKPFQLNLFQINQTAADSTVPHDPSILGQTGGRAGTKAKWFWIEVAVVFVVLFAFAGQPTPDVNESHYLTKAKSYWNPDWCGNDQFLQSSNAHLVFFFVFGWLTKFVSLSTFAWIGRVISWSLFAIAWCRLSRSTGIRAGLSALSVLFFLLLNERFHMAGEWVVGGFEGKAIAYGFTIFTLDYFLRSEWSKMVLMLGLAAAFHVVVAAWVAIAITIAILFIKITNPRSLAFYLRHLRDPRTLLPILGGIALFAAGALPPILNDSGTTISIKAQAAEILVHQRLSHHQLFGDFSTMFVGRFAILIVLWFVFARLVRFDSRLVRINLFCFGSLIIAFAGLLLSGLSEEAVKLANEQAMIEKPPMVDRAWHWSTKLLTLYWFRLADFAVPMALSLLCMRILSSWLFKSPFRIHRIATIGFGSLVVAAGVLMILGKWQDPRPRADRTALPSYLDDQRTIDTFENWKNVCHWIREQTPADAIFITPDAQQTFKWYAHRGEVVAWKDVPQDSSGVVEWHDRAQKFCLPQRRYQHGLLSYTDDQLLDLAKQYEATYLLVPQIVVDLTMQDSKFPKDDRIEQVYPESPDVKSTYAVFKLNVD